jgi:hypothetical protein
MRRAFFASGTATANAWKGFAVGLGLCVLVALPAKATTVVLMDFDGDAAFPSLTYGANTTGLASFTGSAFGLSAPDLATVESNILAKVTADYAPYDISFVTDTTGLSSWYTWGIDDTAYVFPNTLTVPDPGYNPIDANAPCPASAGGCNRLYGKASNTPGAVDKAGNNIYNPTYARTWAGSFALGAGTASPSSPSLEGDTVEHISQALANSAAHEIAHLFGVGHPAGCAAPCFDLMFADIEANESTRDKSFSAGDRAILLEALGPSQDGNNNSVPEPAPLALLGAALFALLCFSRRSA